MQSPPYLKHGDKVSIVAPAKRLQSDIESAIQVLESWGLRVHVSEHLFEESNLFAGTDEVRLTELQDALDDVEVRALLMARGGYGTTRILDQLDFTTFLTSPKWLCGFSDITVLLQKCLNIGVASIHSTIPVLMGREEHQRSDESLRKALFGEQLSYNFSDDQANRVGESSGIVCGGNLSMICNSIGTLSEVKTDNAILFIEDVGEYLYHLDRMLVHLKRAGKFDNLRGLIVGCFTNMKDHKDSFGEGVYDIILNQLGDHDFPIAFGFQAGHEAPNLALCFGRKAKLRVNDNSAELEYKAGQ